mmetsp:Transcript_3842/g.6335  ORF Transcript_3842/g.6335 Transcript_3842/m.6335 type:complete len:219 (-) Transcript_3842:89-745(-)
MTNHGSTTNIASNTNITAAWAQRRARIFRGLLVTLVSMGSPRLDAALVFLGRVFLCVDHIVSILNRLLAAKASRNPLDLSSSPSLPLFVIAFLSAAGTVTSNTRIFSSFACIDSNELAEQIDRSYADPLPPCSESNIRRSIISGEASLRLLKLYRCLALWSLSDSESAAANTNEEDVPFKAPFMLPFKLPFRLRRKLRVLGVVALDLTLVVSAAPADE